MGYLSFSLTLYFSYCFSYKLITKACGLQFRSIHNGSSLVSQALLKNKNTFVQLQETFLTCSINRYRKEEMNISLSVWQNQEIFETNFCLCYCIAHLLFLFYKRNQHPNSGKLILNTSPPSSRSAGFLNEAAISCPDNLSLHLMAHCVASSTSMDSVMIKFTHLILFKNL